MTVAFITIPRLLWVIRTQLFELSSFFGSWGFTVTIMQLIFVVCFCFYKHYLYKINVQAWRSVFRFIIYRPQLYIAWGWDSSVGIVTRYGLDGPRIESQWRARFSAPVQTGPGAHPASCTIGTGSFPGVERSQGMKLTPHPLPVPRSKNRV
jgi:hypothetical protein